MIIFLFILFDHLRLKMFTNPDYIGIREAPRQLQFNYAATPYLLFTLNQQKHMKCIKKSENPICHVNTLCFYTVEKFVYLCTGKFRNNFARKNFNNYIFDKNDMIIPFESNKNIDRCFVVNMLYDYKNDDGQTLGHTYMFCRIDDKYYKVESSLNDFAQCQYECTLDHIREQLANKEVKSVLWFDIPSISIMRMNLLSGIQEELDDYGRKLRDDLMTTYKDYKNYLSGV